MGKAATITGGSRAEGQDAVTLTQLSGTYQVVTQTRWMRPDAKRANRRQRRTGEARGDKEGGGQNGNGRHSHVKTKRNLGPSESWGTCLEGYGMPTAGGPQVALTMPRIPALPQVSLMERKRKGDSCLEGQALLTFGENSQGLSNGSQPRGVNSLNWLARGGR